MGDEISSRKKRKRVNKWKGYSIMRQKVQVFDPSSGRWGVVDLETGYIRKWSRGITEYRNVNKLAIEPGEWVERKRVEHESRVKVRRYRKLQATLKLKGLSVVDLCELIGVKKGTLYPILNGQQGHLMTDSLRRRIAYQLGMGNEDWLFERE